MYLRFSTAVRAFALGLAFTESALCIVDETRIAACTINRQETHRIDLEFEGFNSLGEIYAPQVDHVGVNCASTIMRDEKRPKDQNRIDGLIETIGTIKTIDELDPTENKIKQEQLT